MDVDTHLKPFARTHKTVILAGMTYEEILPDQPFVNSALWIIPEETRDYGLQIQTRRQGKQYLSKDEPIYDAAGNKLLQDFRPCQWLIGYPCSTSKCDELLWLTAAICFDATDLALVSDLRDRSDVIMIPAFNKDVKTFDNMALALHYHMFQVVIVANNGQFGGSSSYRPVVPSYERQIFHFHGQLQANVLFFEVSEIGDLIERRQSTDESLENSRRRKERITTTEWKTPPAGLRRIT